MTEPTHIHGHTLDLVITRKIEGIFASPPCACHYFSDHAAVYCDVAISRPSFQTRTTKFRKLNPWPLRAYHRTMYLQGYVIEAICPITLMDLDALVEDYTTILLSQVFDRHAPLKTKTVQARPKLPWYTSEIAEAKRRRRKAERKWRRTRSQEDLLAFKKFKNRDVTYISTRPKRAFYSDFVNDNSEDQGKLFRAIRSLSLPRNELCFPEYTDNSILANDIGRVSDRKKNSVTLSGDFNAPDIDWPNLDSYLTSPSERLLEMIDCKIFTFNNRLLFSRSSRFAQSFETE